jgi:endonuclease/exonuclease/phosphatase family metal-dependent hydrolase
MCKRLLRIVAAILLTPALYVLICLIYGTLTDYQPPSNETLALEGNGNPTPIQPDSTLTFLNWNVGYGGLGSQSNFFYDDDYFFTSGGKMVRSPKNLVEGYLQGQKTVLANHPSDFYLLQEVDVNSKRSYHINEHELYAQQLPQYARTFALNYNNKRVPLPLCEPWNVLGKTYSGLSTFSRYRATRAARHQFPGKFGWPTRLFQLDRCFAEHRYPVSNGKELVVVNTHNSAYDDGSLKKAEMAHFKSFVQDEYAKGNYVVVGGDWNQCPPNFAFNQFMSPTDSSYLQIQIPDNYLPADWKWVYDSTIPTNRKLADVYAKGNTFVTLIDFYLVSPNVEVLKCQADNTEFRYSDHQPVLLSVRLH